MFIDKRFIPKILLKYSQMEEVERIEDINHPLIREALRLLEWEDPGLEINSMADIPDGTGWDRRAASPRPCSRPCMSARKT